MTCLNLPGDGQGNMLNPWDICHGCAAELHHDACHGPHQLTSQRPVVHAPLAVLMIKPMGLVNFWGWGKKPRHACLNRCQGYICRYQSLARCPQEIVNNHAK